MISSLSQSFRKFISFIAHVTLIEISCQEFTKFAVFCCVSFYDIGAYEFGDRYRFIYFATWSFVI